MSDQNIKSYHEQKYIDYTLRLREILKTLPPFAKDYFRAIEPKTSAKTRISYAYDIRIFFHFLMENNPVYRAYTMDQFTVKDLERIEPVDIEEYQEYLKVYKGPEDKQITNTEKGLARKMSALRSFYAYYFKRQVIEKNPTLLVDMPKLHDKAIIRLDTDEVASLLDYIEHGGDDLTGQRKVYYEKTKNRDLAIITLLLGTGIRVSECVGLDIQDVDFKNNGVKVTRKGGNEMVVYFGEEVENALKMYLYTTRKTTAPLPGHENALFLSTQRRRIGVQAVENMVKKYARQITPNKKITPHKLRSTYGTALYKETGDIYLVADVLGHKDVNTTKKHYAAIDENRRRQAAGAVKLREP
ncbi:tyrosine-type recombinase/integrase [Faecalicatena sp. AGMB00832]|uniref:Tyrosine-type recombinase/integrase n=1 Tax=Faecalicatena faecalis TaxID=2726362 RepID=A0ABS6D5M0_9FIRM|nr:tyrosine-type recombinase/integrase [Faecalicatena sp.]MBU3876758.1 tyrosine-type recombinase/integrase [Faecalicatena faecalis]MCI6467189.1 tyrosine-type recombinase/integrase [Faecalicatena sp.]MDY5620194.1 tyrosine-type recombinase/integrase [Lachnospiraceae bacterium]